MARVGPQTNFILYPWGGLLPVKDASVLALTNIYYDTGASPLLYDSGVWRRFIAAAASTGSCIV